MYIWIIFMLLCVFLDQITKCLVVIYMDLYESVDIIPGVLRFTYIRNEGAAFGSFSDSRWVFMVLSAVAIVGILVYFFVKKPQNKLFCSALTLIVGGGVGNMIDRIRLGYVVVSECLEMEFQCRRFVCLRRSGTCNTLDDYRYCQRKQEN